MVGRTARCIVTVALLCVVPIYVTWAPSAVHAAPDADHVARFDDLMEKLQRRTGRDVSDLHAELIAIDRNALDDERWIDLHVALMHVTGSMGGGPPKPGLPEGVSNPAASSTDSFDRRCVKRGVAPHGEEAYAHKLRHTHGLEWSAMRVLRIGRRARDGVRGELEEFAREHGNGRTWQAMIDEGRAHRPVDMDDLLARYRRHTAEAEAVVRGKGLVTVPEEAYDVRVKVNTGHFPYPFAIYQPGKDWKSGKLGAVVLGSVPKKLKDGTRDAWFRDFDDHFIRTVAAHEGVPGHHLQFTVGSAAFSGARRRAYNSVYVEGWGFYCEGLMARNGFVKEPLDRLAMLRMRAWRAVRCYVDPALHAGLIKPSEAVQMLRDEALFSDRAARMEVDRYLRDPTQPMGYWVGRREIERMREAYLELHGADAERAFHDRLLAFGSVPLPLAAAILLDKRRPFDALHPYDPRE